MDSSPEIPTEIMEQENGVKSPKEEKKGEEEIIESSEKFSYHFDNPLLKESGYIQIFEKRIEVLFPEQIEKSQLYVPVRQFYINKQLVFHTNWLAITTSMDLVKCQDILYRLYCEYIRVIYWHAPGSHATSKFYNESSSLYNNSLYSLSCYENCTTTSIELDLKMHGYYDTTEQNKPFHVQLYIGPHRVFCSETHLSNLDAESVHFILSYVLYKLII